MPEPFTGIRGLPPDRVPTSGPRLSPFLLLVRPHQADEVSGGVTSPDALAMRHAACLPCMSLGMARSLNQHSTTSDVERTHSIYF